MKKFLFVLAFILTNTIVAQTQKPVENFEDHQVTVYPSTFKEAVHIELSPTLLAQTIELQLYDQLGKLIFSDKIISNSASITLRNLPGDMSAGIYYFKLTAQGYEKTFKLLKE